MQAADQTVRSYVLNAIDTGLFATGSRLPTERHLSEMLAVGRGAVRSALAVLEGEGRILRRPGSGTFVADKADRPVSLAERTSPLQVMEARLAIEPTLARLVVTHGTARDFAAMEACIEAGTKASSIDAFEHWDSSFHEAIAAATGNPVIVEAYKLVTLARSASEWGVLKRRTLTNEMRERYQRDHTEILNHLRHRDIEAAETALRLHLISIRSALLGEK